MEKTGERIRMERLKRKLTLERISQETGLSKSFLSQIERNITQPSITSIKRIARYFGISVVALLTDETLNVNHWGYAGPSTDKNGQGLSYARDVSVVNPGRRKGITLPGSSVAYEVLTPDLNRQLQVLFMRIHKGDTSGDEPTIEPPGEKFGFVLKGTIEVRSGDEVRKLQEGDSMCFPADVPHFWRGLDGDVIEVIWVVTPPTF
jgi:transcriptional regulator with XRE-family HTH domain/quercetin dioxygenase-like cupin family protein